MKALHVQLPRGVHTPPPNPRIPPKPQNTNFKKDYITFLEGHLCTKCHAPAFNYLKVAQEAASDGNLQPSELPGNLKIPEGVYAYLGFSGSNVVICATCSGIGHKVLCNVRNWPRPPPRAQNGELQETAEVMHYASSEAILALLHASNSLPNLQILDLAESSIAVSDVSTFCDAIVAFAPTLSELCVDSWMAQDNSTKPISEYTRAVRWQVLDAISRLKILKRLRIREWKTLVREDCNGGRILAGLKHLEEISVASYPGADAGSAGGVSASNHFDPSLPFKQIS